MSDFYDLDTKRGRQRARQDLIAEFRGDPYCWICGKDFSETDPPTLDHFRPRSRGGSDHRKNLRLAHGLCNKARGSRQSPTGIVAAVRAARQAAAEGAVTAERPRARNRQADASRAGNAEDLARRATERYAKMIQARTAGGRGERRAA